MRFGHYWPKDPAAEKIEHLRPASAWPRPELPLYSSMPMLNFVPFEIGGTDERDTPSGASAYVRARPVRPLRSEYLAPTTGHVRFLR